MAFLLGQKENCFNMYATMLTIILMFQSFIVLIKAEDEDITVKCNPTDMTVSLRKDFIPDFSLEDLSLLDATCDFEREANYTHFHLVIPLVNCGTLSQHTNNSVLYSNVIQHKPVAKNAVINRLPALEIPIRCSYPKKVAASYANIGVKQRTLELKVEDGSGEFNLQMGLFKDETFVEEYDNFPVTVPLNERLFFQLNVDSADKSLSIVADTCFATPTRFPSATDGYIIVKDRCPKDDTYKAHPSPPGAQRFSFQAFQFVKSTDVPYVFIHCEVRLCNATDDHSSCAMGCEEPLDVKQRLRRATTEDTFSLEQGPIVILTEVSRDAESYITEHEDSPFNTPLWLLVGMGFVCLLCLLVLLYTRHQLLTIRSSHVVKTTRL